MASRYFINGGVDSNWGSTSNWSTTSGGAGGSAVPLNTDDVFFDGNSPNCTVNLTSRVAKTLDFTGFTGTITMSQQITASGSVTLSAAMTIAGSGALVIGTTATLTSNGKVWPNALTLTGTLTFADNWSVSGTCSLASGGTTVTLNGNTLTCLGSVNHGNGIVTGTTTIVLGGTGTYTYSGTVSMRSNLTINTSGTITFAGSSFRYDTGTLTYIAGTVVSTGVPLTPAAGMTFACGGMTWDQVTLTSTGTYTLTENLNVSGVLKLGTTSTVVTINGSALNVAGGVTHQHTSGTVVGTTVLTLTGTQTVNSTALTSGRISLPIVINAPAGTVTFVSPLNLDIGKVQLTSGTVITDSGTWSSGGGGGGRILSSSIIGKAK